MYDTVLVPTDGSEAATRAVEQGLAIADRFDATVHVLFVADVDERTPWDLSESQPAESMREYGRNLTDGVAEQAPADLEVVPVVEAGDPREEILAYADEHGVDVIVMGTRGLSGIDRFLLGSVAEHVMRNAECSVLVTRADDDERPVETATAALEVARAELESAERIDAETLRIDDDPHEMGGYWIVSAETDERAFNVHISRATGTARIADVTGE
ncbi:universal stress protein [Halopiger goleimassiliensis]|uniref:universal stress protein n=1 Tax=Halopiger goleimassiliensis TaxID=1293048 RepID=UPI0006778FB8|nr:universal stress protein [Halopiger goleimassiliensis]